MTVKLRVFGVYTLTNLVPKLGLELTDSHTIQDNSGAMLIGMTLDTINSQQLIMQLIRLQN